MATQEEILKLRLAIEGRDQAEGLRSQISAVETHIDKLRGRLQAAPPNSPMFNRINSMVEGNIGRLIDLQNKLAETEKKIAGSSLVGAERSAAKARLGLAGANILQDAIQGGPASTINNFLGLAGDKKIMALGGEFVAAAGGATVLVAAVGSVAVAAGGMFLVLDNGLKNAKLGWSDLDDVAGNLAPIKAASEAFEGIGQVAESWGITGAISSAWDATQSFAGDVAQLTIGWRDATAEVRAHKEEVERAVGAARDYADAVKNLGKVQSDEQKQAADTGKLVGGEIADLGGAGGVNAVAENLAKLATSRGGDDKVKVQEITKEDGKEVAKEVEVTRREARRRDILTDISKAEGGDTAALGRLMPLLKKGGYDLQDLNMAARGVDPEDEAKEDQKAQEAEVDAYNAAEQARVKREWEEYEETLKAAKKAADEAEKLAEKDEKDRIEENDKFRDDLAKWQQQEQDRIDKEDSAAKEQDLMKARTEGRDRTSQIFQGSAALQSSVQATIKSERDKTETEKLAIMREIKSIVQKQLEQRRVEEAARAG